MNFKMDEQSFNDLNIFSTHKTTFSVFDFFKKSKTLGGRIEIDKMMRNPTNDLAVLTSRMEAIRFFKDSTLDLDIDHTQFDLILHYLNYTDGYIRGNIIDSLLAYTSNQIKPNPNYYRVRIGLKHLKYLLEYSSKLASDLIIVENSENIKELGKNIKAILEIEGINYILTLSMNKVLRFDQIGKLDSIIRRKHKLKIIELLTIFYQLDAFETLAKVMKKEQFCLTMFIEHKENVSIEAEELFHPAIATPVTNNIKIGEKNNIVFLSGSNMAGKSSLLKSIGLAIYLSHIGFPVPATSFKTSVFNGLITTINLSDNIQNGLSHYVSEVMRVKKMASWLVDSQKVFVIIDELFKGTNAKDAFNASKLVIEKLSEIQHSIFIVSSHITELVETLKDKPVSFMYLEHLMLDKKPHFTHLLKEGVTSDGIGMYFIEKENILELLNRAKLTANI